jgi:hypothetical protein
MRLVRFHLKREEPPLPFQAGRKRALLPLLLLLTIAGIGPFWVGSGLSSDEDRPTSGQEGSKQSIRTGTVVPQPSVPETFADTPTPIVLRIVNRGGKSVFLQGIRQGEEKVQVYFYHRQKGQGWKPFFESLPCDLPTCRNLHTSKQGCGKGVPFAISLGPAGTAGSVKELKWDGLLYQRIEATQEDRQRRYCYKGWVPTSGRIRIEIEFSETAQIGRDKKEMIEGRDHTVLEFDLPSAQEMYDIVVGH